MKKLREVKVNNSNDFIVSSNTKINFVQFGTYGSRNLIKFIETEPYRYNFKSKEAIVGEFLDGYLKTFTYNDKKYILYYNKNWELEFASIEKLYLWDMVQYKLKSKDFKKYTFHDNFTVNTDVSLEMLTYYFQDNKFHNILTEIGCNDKVNLIMCGSVEYFEHQDIKYFLVAGRFEFGILVWSKKGVENFICMPIYPILKTDNVVFQNFENKVKNYIKEYKVYSDGRITRTVK